MAKLQSLYRNPHRITLIGFGLIICLGAFLLALPISSTNGTSIGFIDALFTATSAVCVTGLVVLDTGTAFTMFGQIVIMLLIQIGGLGFMTYGVLIAVLLGKKIGLTERLIVQEATKSILSQGIVRLVLNIVIIAFTLEALAALVLTAYWTDDFGLGQAFYYASFHAVSAFNNAGFALWADSLTQYVGDPVVNIIISFLFIIGGIGFTVIMDIVQKKKWRFLSLHSKIVLSITIILIGSGTLAVFLLEFLNPYTLGGLGWSEKLWAAFFQGVTTRTAGFNSVDMGSLMYSTQFIMIIFMFIGASSGSTGGGIKTNTFVVLLLTVWSIIRGNRDVQIFKRRVSNEIILRALTVILISLFLVFFVTFLLSITEHATERNFMDILFEVTSAFGTVGLSVGLTPELSFLGKLIIIMTMFIGRLGPLTLAYALAQKKYTSHIRYPEEKVLIG